METPITISLYVIQLAIIILVSKFYPLLLQDSDNSIEYFRNEVKDLNGKLTI